MMFRYFFGGVLSNLYRLLKVFPNSDPIMSFVLSSAKNESWWKSPLFAFSTMFSFDLMTGSFGVWTWVTSITYALIAFSFHFIMKKRKSNISNYVKFGALGVIIFDFITGPIMSSVIFQQNFLVTLILQIPFTIMHFVSVSFFIIIIVPFFDKEVNKEVFDYLVNLKFFFKNFGWGI